MDDAQQMHIAGLWPDNNPLESAFLETNIQAGILVHLAVISSEEFPKPSFGMPGFSPGEIPGASAGIYAHHLLQEAGGSWEGRAGRDSGCQSCHCPSWVGELCQEQRAPGALCCSQICSQHGYHPGEGGEQQRLSPNRGEGGGERKKKADEEGEGKIFSRREKKNLNKACDLGETGAGLLSSAWA